MGIFDTPLPLVRISRNLSVLFIRKIWTFLNPLPLSVGTSYVNVPFLFLLVCVSLSSLSLCVPLAPLLRRSIRIALLPPSPYAIPEPGLSSCQRKQLLPRSCSSPSNLLHSLLIRHYANGPGHAIIDGQALPSIPRCTPVSTCSAAEWASNTNFSFSLSIPSTKGRLKDGDIYSIHFLIEIKNPEETCFDDTTINRPFSPPWREALSALP